LQDLININKTNYPQLQPILGSLIDSRSYFLSKANEAQTVVTISNLKDYTADYLLTSIEPEHSLRYGILGHKIAKLVKIQVDSKKALESLKYKLPESASVRVGERVRELEKTHEDINIKIDDLANYVISPEGKESVDSPIFFAGRVEKLDEIRTLQIDWIDRLIDLDLNYGKI